MAETIHGQVTDYVSDAHSIEEQALAQLRAAPELAGTETLAKAYRDHLLETEEHERITRRLLEGRGGTRPLKDAVMKIGGKGFVLFARANPDTPGKLLAHSLSYEALEEASYALLALVADRAGDSEVVDAARRIERDELAMRERLAASFDESVEASLRDVPPKELDEQLARYLADAHAIEEQAIGLLERAADRGDGPLSSAYREHLAETRVHSDLIESRLDAVGRDPSTLKDALMRIGAINWAMFFEAHPDTPGKLAAFAYAFEYLEIGGYEQLKRVAERAGDGDTVALVDRILAEERTAAARLYQLFPQAAALALAANVG
jgi:ferritin-like metal-binding protein YciE